jgi:PAS domain S-box-containing protein
MKRAKFFHSAAAPVFALLLMLLAGSARAGEAPFSVLILNSYHRGFAWTDGIMDGILETFAESGVRANFSIEFMDTKRTPSIRTISSFYSYFSEKYSGKTFDLILCTDDDATCFMFRRGQELFPATPVVFCGLNNPEIMNARDAPPFTGVLEKFDMPGAVRLIQSLFPRTRNIALVSDLSPSGMSVISQARRDLSPFRDRFVFSDFFGLGGDELREKISRLPPDTAVLVLVYFQDDGGEFYSPKRTADLLRSAGPFPAFGLWSMMIEGGLLGGNVLIPREHGASAAKMAVRILRGESPADIPPAEDTHLVPMFNYGELARFGLGSFDIPGGAVITGEPETFLYRYRAFIMINAAVAAAAIIYILALFINERFIKAAEKAAKLKAAQWESLFQNAPEAYTTFDSSNEIITVNKGFEKLFGYTAEEAAGKNLDSIVANYPGINADARALSAKAFSGEGISAEGLRVRRDGSLFYAEISGSIFPDGEDGVSGFAIYRDASRRKEEESEMMMNMKRESIISSVSARLLEEGAGGVSWALAELASFLRIRRGALVETDGDGAIKREFILNGGEVKAPSSAPLFSAVPPAALRRLVRRLWSENPLMVDGEDEENGREFRTLEEAGCARRPAYIQPVYSGREDNAFLLLETKPSALSYSDSALVTMFCALAGSALQREGRMAAMKETNRQLEAASRGIVEILGRALAMKDPFTVGHQINVARLVREMAVRGGYDEVFCERVYYAGLVHDLGKIAIPSSILSKPGRLTALEFDIIKEHVRHGWEILASAELPWPLAEIVLQHHERLDGSGYPEGIRGDAIGKEARFISAADVAEAMTSDRPYRPGLGKEAAVAELKRFRGIRYDPEAADLCIGLIEEGFALSEGSYPSFATPVSPVGGFTV